MAQTRDKTKAPIIMKLLLVGNSFVGKSSLLLRFSDKQWLSEDKASATIGVDFRVHNMEVNGEKVKLSIWDTAGTERFSTMSPSYYRGAQGVILVYDVAQRVSFDALPKWFAELSKYVSSDVVKIIVGNKVDKESSRQVPHSEGEAFAAQMDALFIEASAKTAVGVQEAFRDVVERILETPDSRDADTMEGIDLSKDAGDAESGGCWC